MLSPLMVMDTPVEEPLRARGTWAEALKYTAYFIMESKNDYHVHTQPSNEKPGLRTLVSAHWIAGSNPLQDA